jgi:hypothetical protein
MGKGLHSHGGIKEMIKVIPRKDLIFFFFFSNEARAIGGSFPFLIRMNGRSFECFQDHLAMYDPQAKKETVGTTEG